MTLVSSRVRAGFSRQPRRSPGRAARIRLALILAASAAFASCAAAQGARPEEYQVKAVYLYNFGRFIDWPAAAAKDDSFAICVLGGDPFGAALDATVAGEKIGDRNLVARRIATAHDAPGCRILFVSSSEASHVKDILGSLNNSSILTVSDIPGFTGDGGMIEFVTRENKVRFEVNLTRADKAGLIFSSQLLKVAADVRREPGDNPGATP